MRQSKPEGDGGKPPVLVLTGPTASGKSALALRLFAQERIFPAEIVSADSMQVYRGMDIGTAKPSAGERALLPYHLIDIRAPDEQYNAGDFVREAEQCCRAIAGRGKTPVICGGTGFYIKTLITGLPPAPPSDEGLRSALKDELAARGLEALRAELAEGDPVSAARIHPNDRYRLLRALEVLRLSGKPLSAFTGAGPGRSAFRYTVLGLCRERQTLYRGIERRCESMFQAGLPDEVRALFLAGFSPECPGLKAIGYREFFVRDDGGRWRLNEDLPAVQAAIVQDCRHYAKRQFTFCNSIPGLRWIDVDRTEALDTIRKALREAIDDR